MLKHHFKFYMAVAGLLLALPQPARAIFGVGDVVFDPTMYAGELQQLQQETATVTNLAQQLQYAIKNTTGGAGGAWQSNQNLLSNLGGLISEQQGLSYTFGSPSNSSSSTRATMRPLRRECKVRRPAPIPRSTP